MIISGNSPSASEVLRDPVLLIAFGLGSGLSPRAPGTAGSLLGMVCYPLLAQLHLAFFLLFVLGFAVFGGWVCDRASKKLGVHDHGGIVIDEIAGIWLAMTAIPPTWYFMLGGFVLFRFFDIVKPWPIRFLDRRLKGGVGIMIDDIVAGLFTWLILVASQFILERGTL